MPPRKIVGKKTPKKAQEMASADWLVRQARIMRHDPVVQELERRADALPTGSRKRLRFLVTAGKIVSGEGGRKYYELIRKKFGVRLH